MDIDDLMNRFRLSSRELFNHYFRVADPYENDGWQYEERFSELQKLLFKKLVIEPAELTGAEYGTAQDEIQVRLRNLESAPFMLNREIDSGYWDDPLKCVTEDARLLFVQFFDWDQLGYRDNRYVRVIVNSWPSNPDAAGKHALIETHHVQFVMT